MHVYLTISSLSKNTGGPATVVQHLSEYLLHLGVSVTVVTTATEPASGEVLPRDHDIDVVRVPSGAGSGWRSALDGRLQRERKPAPTDQRIVHDFGLWLPANHAVASVCNRLNIPRVCSPCGMLAPWALRHKAWKKKLAWWLYQRRDLSRSNVLVATAGPEMQDIHRNFPGKPIALVPNGVELRATTESRTLKPELRDQGSVARSQGRRVVFLGRLHPVKGLNNLVEAWNRVQPVGWQCILAGPNEAGHQAELEKLIRRYHLQNSFQFPGMMANGAKRDLLEQADVFVLPSFTENFGVAAAEALACGLPVIATKGTPWQEIVEHKCGWWVDMGVEPLAEALKQAFSMTEEQRRDMGRRGRRLIAEKYSWPKIAADMKAVYEWVLGSGSQPRSVH